MISAAVAASSGTVEPKRDQPVASDRLLDQLRQCSRRNDLAVIDDHGARASRFRFFEVMRGQQQRHAAVASSASMS